MNVTFPLMGTAYGFWVDLVVMVATALALYLVFKRKDWI